MSGTLEQLLSYLWNDWNCCFRLSTNHSRLTPVSELPIGPAY